MSSSSIPAPLKLRRSSSRRNAKLATAHQLLEAIGPEAILDDIISKIYCCLDQSTTVDLTKIPCLHDDKIPGISLVPNSADLAHTTINKTVVFKKGEHVEVSGDYFLKKQTGWDNGMILLGSPQTSGLLSWSFRFKSGTKATVGVCLADVAVKGWVNKSSKGWGYYQYTGHVGNAGKADIPYGDHFTEPGDIVDMEYDVSRGALRFYVNGAPQGDAFTDLPTADGAAFVAAISLYEEGASVHACNLEQPNPAIPLLLMAINRENNRHHIIEELAVSLTNSGIPTSESRLRPQATLMRLLLSLESDCMWNICSYVLTTSTRRGLRCQARRRRVAIERPCDDRADDGEEGYISIHRNLKLRQRSLFD